MHSTTRVLLWFAYLITLVHGAPSSLSRGQFYPTKDVSDPAISETLQCGKIRDLIRRNTIRFNKVLIRTTNSLIDFGSNDDNRYMTSRAKSKLDVLASKVQSKWGLPIKLRVEKAWTSVFNRSDMLSLHYEGRTLKVTLSGSSNASTEINLGQLCGLAIASGFDWVYHESSNYIRISVIPDVCQTELDLAFVIDGSGSVGYADFATVKKFLGEILEFYNVGFNQTRVALISYSSTPTVQFPLNKYGTKPEIKSAISQVPFEGGSTATGSALSMMKDDVFSTANGMRDNSVPKVGILITDGYSDNSIEVITVSDEVKAAGVSMFVIGIGSSLNDDELAAVASDPDSEHLFYHGFEDLSGFVDQMSTTSCNEGAQINQYDNAETKVDGGSFKYFKSTFDSSTTKVTIEIEDLSGTSYVYASTSNKNPGPLDLTGTVKGTGYGNIRAVTLNVSSTSKLVYISVQGQEDKNTFVLSIWDSIFERDKYQKAITENGIAGQIVAVVKSDKNGTFVYKMKAGNSAGHFAINNMTGEVRTTQTLDREIIANYTLVIIAQDVNVENHRGRTELFVKVNDVNDNKPRFDRNLYHMSVNDSAAVAYQLGLASATDMDFGSNGRLHYSIVSGIAKEDFSIGPATGIVSVASPLDYRIKSRYLLGIQVEDGGNPPKFDMADLIINVVSLNEAPMFTGDCSSGCHVSIDEGDAIGRQVKQLSATDPDNSVCQLKFSIISSDGSYFSINETSGMITTKNAIDRETKEVYELRVVVRDCASPPLTDSVTVLVTANDINDNAPRFLASNYTAYVNENRGSGTNATRSKATDVFYYDFESTAAKELLNVSAIDPDLGKGGTVKFRLLSSERADRNGKERREVIIEAHDEGTPIMSSNATFIIRNRVSCDKMSFKLTEYGMLSATTICSFKASPNGSYERIAGESFSLDCRAEGNDMISYRWTKDRDTISVMKNNGVLVIDKVSRKHTGTYECFAQNGAGTISAPTKATLVVKDRPYIFEHPVDMTVEVGGRAMLSCKATGYPTPRYQWRKNGEIYQAGIGYNTNRLLLNDLVLDDAGVYHCEAISPAGIAESKKAALKVVDREKVVLLTVVINNPSKDGRCHFFSPQNLENFLGQFTKKIVSVTKFDRKKFCNKTRCEPNPCRHGGKCELTSKSYKCVCKRGWRGLHCLQDLDECKSGEGPCSVGECQNVRGSYWCKCPAGKTGQNCQYEESVCRANPCQVDEVCLPNLNTTSANHTCVAKSKRFTTMLKVKKENDMMNSIKFNIEADLTSALENSKEVNTQAVSTGINFTSCSTRVTSFDTRDELNGNLVDVDVKHFILCPGNGSKAFASHSVELCNVLLSSIDNAKECKIENGTAITPKPVTTLPAVEVDIEAVVTDTVGNRILNAAEAINLMNPEIINDHLKSENIDVRNIATAFPDETGANDDASGFSKSLIAIIIAVGVILALATVAASISKRRRMRKKRIAGAKLAENDGVALERLDKL